MAPKKFLRVVAASPYLYGAVALACAALVYVSFFRNTSAPLQTLTVSPGNFTQQVSVSGVVVAAQDVDLGFSQSGRISHVYAKVGERVRAGQLLAEVENGDLRALVSQKKAALETQRAKLAALEQGTRPEQLAVTESQVANDTVALDQANQAIINAIRDAYNKSDDAVHNQVDQFFINPRSSVPQIVFSVSDLQIKITLESERQTMENMLIQWQTNIAALTTTSDLTLAQAEAQRNLASVASLLSHASAALSSGLTSTSVTQANISSWIINISTARTTINTTLTSLTSAVTAQKSAAAVLEKDQKNLALQRAGSLQADIDAQAAQVSAAEADLESAQAQLQKTLVTAPFGGVVTKMDAKSGEIVSANTSEISMISEGVFQIESYVPEIDVAKVSVDNQATLTLDAYGPDVPFSAKVVSIDPAQTVRSGVSTYKVMLQFVEADPKIRSGMTASVTITTQQKTNVIAVPQKVVFEKNGTQYVWVLEQGAKVLREVKVGSVSTLGDIEILSGLQRGDIVVLSQAGA